MKYQRQYKKDLLNNLINFFSNYEFDRIGNGLDQYGNELDIYDLSVYNGYIKDEHVDDLEALVDALDSTVKFNSNHNEDFYDYTI